MKTRRRKTTKVKRRKVPTAARRRRSSAADLQKQLDLRTRELAEAREQQTATSEVLRVIGTSPSDEQPVYQTIVRSAVSLCGSLFALVFRFDGELLHFAAGHRPGLVTWSCSKRSIQCAPTILRYPDESCLPSRWSGSKTHLPTRTTTGDFS
jgi:hypothetical protein